MTKLQNRLVVVRVRDGVGEWWVWWLNSSVSWLWGGYTCDEMTENNTHTFPSTQKDTLSPFAVISHFHPYPKAATNLLPVSADLPILDISYKWNHTIWSLFCLALFINSIMFLRLNYVLAYISTLFLFIAEWWCGVWIYHILFIHSPIDGHLGFITNPVKQAVTSIFNMLHTTQQA